MDGADGLRSDAGEIGYMVGYAGGARSSGCCGRLTSIRSDGIRTNILLFESILKEAKFRAGDLHTGYLDALLKETPFENPAPPAEIAQVAALVAKKRVSAAAVRPIQTGSRRGYDRGARSSCDDARWLKQTRWRWNRVCGRF